MACELERESIESSIEKLNSLVKKTIPSVKESPEPAKMQLRVLNDLLDTEKERLSIIKELIKMIYNTNESIINSVIEAGTKLDKKIIEKRIIETKEEHRNAHPDLLHGGTGWMFEYEAMKDFHRRGQPAFLTFGTFWDAAKVDVVAIPMPFSTKIRLRHES